MKKCIMILISLVFILSGCQTQTNIIKTQYFHVTIPDSWENLYVHEIYEVDENTYSLNFYEKESYKTMYGGFLFGISIYYDNEDYTYLPSYDYIGKIKNDDVQYHVLVEYPTDVQFDNNTADNYRNLSKDMETIIQSITVNEGYDLLKQIN